MMTDPHFTEQVDRYLRGEMTAAERGAFENIIDGNQEAQQAFEAQQKLVEQLRAHGQRKNFKQQLNLADRHYHAQSAPMTLSSNPPVIVKLWNKFKINALVAASVAILAVFSTLWLSGYYKTLQKTSSNYSALRRDMNSVKKNVNAQNVVIRNINNISTSHNGSNSQFGATGFMISPKGYLVTNYHVIKGADSVHIQNNHGQSYKANVIYTDPESDIAMLQIADSTFVPLKTAPYTFRAKPSDIGEEIYTIGFPRDEIVYGQGYLSSMTGYSGDTTAYQISIPVNPGNSGGPVLDTRGNIIGIISGKQTGIDGASFAIKSKSVLDAIDAVRKETPENKLTINKKNMLSGLSRTEQVKRIMDYVYIVKVY